MEQSPLLPTAHAEPSLKSAAANCTVDSHGPLSIVANIDSRAATARRSAVRPSAVRAARSGPDWSARQSRYARGNAPYKWSRMVLHLHTPFASEESWIELEAAFILDHHPTSACVAFK